MNVINIESQMGEGKENKYIMYNSTFRKMKFAHMYDINAAMDKLVFHNDYKGLVIGIGYPDPPEYFPEEMDSYRLSEEDRPDFERIVSRVPRPEEFKSFFERLYLLKKALNKEIPVDMKKREKLKRLGIKRIPLQKVYMVPKPPHLAYPHLYDLTSVKDFQGYFEPPRKLIQQQYIMRGTHKDRQRAKQKESEKRNIDIMVDDFRGHISKRDRELLLLKKWEESRILKDLNNKAFQLYVTSFFDSSIRLENSLLKDDLKSIEKMISRSANEGEECVLAVPYCKVPVDPKPNSMFWSYLRSGEKIHAMPLAPFQRYSKIKENVDGMFRENDPERQLVHITFMEMETDGSMNEPGKSLSYLPNNISKIYGRKDMIEQIKQMSGGSHVFIPKWPERDERRSDKILSKKTADIC
jgi:hypothetical protein